MWITLPALPTNISTEAANFSVNFNIRGKKANVWVAEHINSSQIAKKLLKQGVGIKDTTHKQKFENYETYYAQPTFISSRKYFYHSLTTGAQRNLISEIMNSTRLKRTIFPRFT
jgi:alpha-glucosidase